MPVIITRVFKKPDGSVTRTIVERHPGSLDGHRHKQLMEQHLKQYPRSGLGESEGHWAEDEDGRRSTFEVTEAS